MIRHRNCRRSRLQAPKPGAASRVAATLAIGLAWLLTASCQQSSQPSTQRPPDIILIVLDTARADAFDLLKGQRTPFLRELAQRSIVFRNAASTFDRTRPSHHSIFTGFYRGSANPEYDQAEYSVVALLRKLGYLTVGISANGLLSQETFNSVRPFEVYFNLLGEVEHNFDRFASEGRARLETVHKRFGFEMFDSTGKAQNTWLDRLVLTDADLVLSRLEQVLVARRDDGRPRFIFLNFLDSHDPYTPSEEFYEVASEPSPHPVTVDLRRRPLPEVDLSQLSEEVRNKLEFAPRNHLTLDLSPVQLTIYRRRYQAEISQLDSKLRELFALLETYDLKESSVIFVTSDHGESFGENGFVLHGYKNRGDFQATRHVPLILVPPKQTLSAGIVVDDEVSIADIRPTIDALVGVQINIGNRRFFRTGQSLLRFAPYLFSEPKNVLRLRLGEEGSLDRKREEEIKELRAMGYLSWLQRTDFGFPGDLDASLRLD